MLLLKMPDEEPKRPSRHTAEASWTILSPAAAATDGCKDASIAAAATARGLAPRRLLVERTEVSEQPITTYRT